jgi:hypothetical protein
MFNRTDNFPSFLCPEWAYAEYEYALNIKLKLNVMQGGGTQSLFHKHTEDFAVVF